MDRESVGAHSIPSVNNKPLTLDSEPKDNCNDAASEPVVLRGDPWRFSVAVVFCFISISNAMQWISFSAIVDEVRVYFNMTAVQVNYLATIYVIAYVCVVFLSCKLYEVAGIKKGIIIAAVANAIGAGLKLVALYVWPHMALLFIAQAFNSITEILTIATPPLIANRWFPEKERGVANAFLSGSLNFGCAIGVLIPTFFVTPEKQSQRHFAHFFWFQFGLCSVMLLLAFPLIPARPRYKASYAAARQQEDEEKRLLIVGKFRRGRTGLRKRSTHSEGGEDCDKIAPEENRETCENNDDSPRNIDAKECAQVSDEEEEPQARRQTKIFSTVKDTLSMLWNNPSFAFLMIASAAELGLIWAVATVLPQCLSTFGVTEVESGWISFLNLFAGTVVAPFVIPFMTKRWSYKNLLVAIAWILTANMSILSLCLAYGPSIHDNRLYYVIVSFVFWGGVAGLCQNFLLPLMFEFVVELTFPMAESTSAPSLTWSACLANLILVIIYGEVLGDEPTQGDSIRIFIGSTVVCFFGGIMLLVISPHSRRTDYEELMRRREKEKLLQQVQSPAFTNKEDDIVKMDAERQA